MTEAITHREISGITKFNGTNYPIWRQRIIFALKNKGLEITIPNLIKPETTTGGTWEKQQSAAMFIISNCLDDSQFSKLLSCTTAKSMLDVLDAEYLSKDVNNKCFLLSTLWNVRMLEGTLLSDHLYQIEQIVNQLQVIDYTVDNDIKLSVLFNSLPPSLDNLKTALSVQKDLSYPEAKAMLQAEALKQKINLGISAKADHLALAAKQQNIVCHNCGGKGYISTVCPSEKSTSKSKSNTNNSERKGDKKQSWNKNKNSKNNATANNKKGSNNKKQANVANESKTESKTDDNDFALTTYTKEFAFAVTAKKDIWILDSGATRHMVVDRAAFSTFQARESVVGVADDRDVKSLGSGTVRINVVVDGVRVTLTLENALFCPSFAYNLFSVRRAMLKQVYVQGGNGFIKLVTQQGKTIAVADDVECQFRLRLFSPSTSCIAPLNSNTNTSNLNFALSTTDSVTLHERLGHIGENRLKHMLKGSATGVSCPNFTSFQCSICPKAKMVRKGVSKEPVKRATQLLEKVHSDICGPFESSIGGSKFFITFTDDFRSSF